MNLYQQHLLAYRQELSTNDHQIDQIVGGRQFMDRHFRENIDLERVARAACCSKYHFIRLFKKYYGLTPHRYLTDLRIRAAREMLAAGVSVIDTCSRLGFESATSFTGLFKTYTGQTPSAYRQIKQHSRAFRN
ncbi:helix-turn-helix domain-containing protein [Flavilitoribacter nigricans]|uniref:AraC family transcriptional regulator n=1 Tax=Flavilitoribacter nigricans (strain ATCC 23147 / DSM 23189 / NBRC 102662 / NCIMB 1420 / SS-2) TaxID=1122177 RepID=A0A2D0NAG0_FLAN2|nr:helix-turn-helix transcriptional regulator [Flavilitoribacter nigricans]PHN04763.1 AraC family transcriptional regulator [Flavilitoribacter nigricans DSM 23189 = NBRC 102662]